MSKPASSGIQTSTDGQAFIPSSRRADGTTRREIKVRPGYKPPEDVETYKSRTAEGWRSKGGKGVPGVDDPDTDQHEADVKSKNAKRREAARKKKEVEGQQGVTEVEGALGHMQLETGQNEIDQEAEHQKKIRNQLKKLKAVKDLKTRKAAGEKLSADQLIKIAKEQEIVRDLVKLNYQGPELEEASGPAAVESRPG